MVTVSHDGGGEYSLSCFEPASGETTRADISDMGKGQRITPEDVRSIVGQLKA